jgi:hypothetical protein
MRATWSKVTTVVTRAALGDEEIELGVTDFFMSLFLTHKNQLGTCCAWQSGQKHLYLPSHHK